MPERMTRRELLRRGATLLGGATLTGVAHGTHAANVSAAMPLASAAQSCMKGARIRWIVGWSPGGGFDTYSRLAEPFIEKTLGAQIAIDNVPGAGGRVGALALARSRPDGRTLGILNGSGFLWERTPDAGATPDLLRDFTVLARVAGRQQVVVGSSAAGVRTLEDLIALSRRRPIIAGITAADSSNFASLAAISDLFGLRTEYISGYPGSREVILGLVRGDMDFTSVDIETYMQVPDLERVVPLLQITPERSPDARIAAVPHLAGETGLITRRPELFAGDAQRARELVAAIAVYLEMGRLFAGPGRMSGELRDCLEQGVVAALRDPGFATAARRAGRSLDVVAGPEVRRGIPAAMAAVKPIEPVATAAARRIR